MLYGNYFIFFFSIPALNQVEGSIYPNRAVKTWRVSPETIACDNAITSGSVLGNLAILQLLPKK